MTSLSSGSKDMRVARIAHFGKRQILTVVGSCFVALLTTPFFGLLALAIALCGELLDCYNLKWQFLALDQGKKYRVCEHRGYGDRCFSSLLYFDLHPPGRSSATGRCRCKFRARFFDVCGAQCWLDLALSQA